MKIRVGIVGVSGYAGLELVRLALEHPEMELAAAMDAREVGEKPVREIHPRLKNICDLITFPPGENRLESLDLDTVFLCTPDKVSIELAPMFLSLDIRVIDLSGGFRIKDESVFSSSYGYQHTNSELLKTAVYGLAEWNAEAIAPAKLVANPGCYPTSVILLLLPLTRAGIIESGSDIICDAKSGVTGAGRAVKPELHFAEVSENFRPYNPIAHRHAPEMCQELGWHMSRFTFVPHLLPMNRGIISTIYIHCRHPIRSADIEAEFERAYSGHPFVRILGDLRLPELRAVNHTNFCDIAWRMIDKGRGAVVFSAIDNLVKGASGQAVQNFNIMHGLEESRGFF